MRSSFLEIFRVWWQFVNHRNFRLSDYYLHKVFWIDINSGFHEMNFSWAVSQLAEGIKTQSAEQEDEESNC